MLCIYKVGGFLSATVDSTFHSDCFHRLDIAMDGRRGEDFSNFDRGDLENSEDC